MYPINSEKVTSPAASQNGQKQPQLPPKKPLPLIKELAFHLIKAPVIVKLAALVLTLVICVTVCVNMQVEYTHDYIKEVRPPVLPPCAPADAAVPANEGDVPIIAAPVKFYDYTLPVPKSSAVDSKYFNDTVFIGDSRTKGLLMYTDLSPLDFSGEGANVDSVQTKSYIRLKSEDGEFETYTLAEALEYKKGSYKAVYIALGLNELGWPLDAFMLSFDSLIKTIRSVTDVPIYVQMIMPMSQQAEDTNRFNLTNAKQRLFNQALIRYCVKARLFRLDPVALFALGDGTLDPNHASDGFHLLPESCHILADYYKTHVVSLENYADTRSKDRVKAPEGVFTSSDNLKPIP